jgi:hypothetical protein
MLDAGYSMLYRFVDLTILDSRFYSDVELLTSVLCSLFSLLSVSDLWFFVIPSSFVLRHSLATL